MRIAIVGSRNIEVKNIQEFLPKNILEIVSGGAKGVDSCAREYALKNGIKLTEFLPNYRRYARAAHLIRNLKIIDYADIVIAFWDGKSRRTKYVIDNCKRINKPIKIWIKNNETDKWI